MVDRCLLAEEALDKVTGEKLATVGGFGSWCCWDAPSSCLPVEEDEDIRSSQGVSLLTC